MSDLEKQILADINLDHESLNVGVKHLQDWLKKQPHLLGVSVDDQQLKAFIIGSKSIERAKQKLDIYFTSRSRHPEVFSNRDPLSIQWNQTEDMIVLPGLTPEGSTVYLIMPPKTKEAVEVFSFVETCRAAFMHLDYELRHRPFTSGQYIVVDGKYATAELLLKFLTSFTAAAFDIYQNSMPIRMKALILFNATPIAAKCVNILKAFFSSKLQKRFCIHSGDQTTLSEYFPLDILPKDYGGNNMTVEQLLERKKQQLESDRDWFMKEGMQKADLSKRPNNEINDGDIVHGTFRKLQID